MDEKKDFYTKTIVVIIGAVICCLLWGSAFPVVKIGYSKFGINASDTANQMLFAGERFTLAGIFATIIGSIISGKFLIPGKKAMIKVVKLSLFQTVAQYVCFYIGLARTTGVRASIVEGTNVFVAIAIASLLFHQEKMTLRKIIGSTIGFSGVVLINIFESEIGGGNYFLGDLLVFLSTFAYGFSSVLLKRYSQEENPLMLSAYQFTVGGIIMALIGLVCGGRVATVTSSGVMILLYLSMVSAVAYSLWGILVKYNDISRVAVFGFMNPVFGVILSALLLNESSALGLTSVLALALVCVGIYIVNRKKGDEK